MWTKWKHSQIADGNIKWCKCLEQSGSPSKYQTESSRVCVLSRFSHALLFMTLWTVAHQAPLSTGFPRQEYGGGSHSSLQGILPTQDQTHVSCVSYTACVFFTAEPLGAEGSEPRFITTEPSNSTPGYIPKKTENIHPRRNTYTHVTAALFIIAEKQK